MINGEARNFMGRRTYIVAKKIQHNKSYNINILKSNFLKFVKIKIFFLENKNHDNILRVIPRISIQRTRKISKLLILYGFCKISQDTNTIFFFFFLCD